MVSSLALHYREHHAWPLTSATTCYSGARRLLVREGAGGSAPVATGGPDEAMLATETHSLALRWHCDATAGNKLSGHGSRSPTISSHPQALSGLCSRANASCVGYAASGKWRVLAFVSVPRSTSASSTATIDPMASALPPTSTTSFASLADPPAGDRATSGRNPPAVSHSRAPSETASAAAAAAFEEGVATADGSIGTTTPGQHHHRHHSHRRSGSWTSVALEAAVANAATGGDGAAHPSSQASALNASSSGLSLLGPEEIASLWSPSSPLSHPMAELVLLHDDENGSVSRRHRQRIWRAPLDFRPISPALSVWSDDEDRVGVWVGSADDRRLRLYRPDLMASSSTPESPMELLAVDLAAASTSLDRGESEAPSFDNSSFSDHDAAITFLSPVLALDALPLFADTSSDRHCLAAACQDGTVRLLSYRVAEDPSSNADAISNVRAFTLIVDGPIACVGLHRTTGGRGVENSPAVLRCVVGSLCGYACEVVWSGTAEATDDDWSWDGPHLVAHGLRDRHLRCEDSVTAIGATEVVRDGKVRRRLVAIGTHSGRCLVYGSAASSSLGSHRPSYELLWHCLLPHPVHGAAFGSNFRHLLVTTRRSAHLFFARTATWWSADRALAQVRAAAADALASLAPTASVNSGVGVGAGTEESPADEGSDEGFVLVSSGESAAETTEGATDA